MLHTNLTMAKLGVFWQQKLINGYEKIQRVTIQGLMHSEFMTTANTSDHFSMKRLYRTSQNLSLQIFNQKIKEPPNYCVTSG